VVSEANSHLLILESRFSLALNRQSLGAATAGNMVLFAGGNVPYKGVTNMVDIN
jgi:hypothetical protein